MRLMHLMLMSSMAAASPAFGADRLTDRDVKELVARIEEGRDRFDDALDGKLKRSIVRGPSGEVNVNDFLNDFQENIDRLEERLKPEYAASAEVATLLRQGSGIDRFFHQQPPGTKGESEWNRLAADLKSLAAAYGADFPLPEGASVRRMGDREVAAAADEVARSADDLKKSLNNDLKKETTVQKTDREAIVREADQLSKDAKALRGRVRDAKPSSAEADRLLSRAAELQAFVDSHQLPTAAGVWTGIRTRLQELAGAYGAPMAR
ncbi:MAG TPA: hypothetical protein VFO14_22755 [Vicinamibacterales bacterium]|nr:hypothetical protein [Vicinamibacterales bacterium]